MNITQRFQKLLSTDTQKHILGYKDNGVWKWITRKQLGNKIHHCIDVLKQRNISLHDRVIYKGRNSVDWVAWNVATNAIGGIWVPLYNDQKDDYVNHIINDCKPKLFISQDTHFKNVEMIKSTIHERESNNYEISFNKKSDIANLIYTSGTTGKPKGVILSHVNILSNIDAINKRFSDFKHEKQYTSLNILPWAHIYGLTTELYYNLLDNNKVAISSGPEQFIDDLKDIQPHTLYLVPRVLQMIKQKVEKFDKPIIQLVLPYIMKYVFGKNLMVIFIGGAQLDDSTKHFYSKYGINICEGYGCTETSPLISVNHLKFPRDIKSVGSVLDNLLIKIVENEIYVSGPSVMRGYWNNPEATDEVLVNFENNSNVYYKTGDEGVFNDGFIYYKGRIKENYKLDNGKFINVEEIENIIKKYTTHPFMIYGSNQSYNIIIIESDSNINDSILGKINKELDSYKQIKNILQVERNTFQKFYTPKMSIKRNEIEQFLKDDIQKVYSQNV